MLIPTSVLANLKKQGKRPIKEEKPVKKPDEAFPESGPNQVEVLPKELSEAQATSDLPTIEADQGPAKRVRTGGSNITVAEITPEYLQSIVSGFEVCLSDYALQDPANSTWLSPLEREIEGKGQYFHLSSFVQMSKFAMLKPPVSQPILKRAFLEYPSALFSTHRLEDKGMIQRVNIQPNKYHPRDQRTERIVYVEPHNAKIASNIPLFTYLIKSHNPEKEKWFPIQAVFRDDDQLTNKYAYVLMNGNVEMAWSKGTKKWKELWPDNWIVMPKKEQEKRTEEYKALHRQELDEAEDAEPGKQAHWGLEEAEAFPKPEESDKQSSVTHSVRDSSNLKGHVSKTQSTRMNSLAIADKGTVEVKPQIEQPKKASRKQAAKRKMKKKKAAKKAAAKSGEEDT